MSAPAFPFVPAATQALAQLQASLSSATKLESLLRKLGWRASLAPSDLAPLNTALSWLGDLQSIGELANSLRHQEGDTLELAGELGMAIQSLFKKVSEFSAPTSLNLAPFNERTFWPAFLRDLPPYLLATALREASPVAYALLLLTGALVEESHLPTAAEAQLGRLPYTRFTLHWTALGEFISHPVQSLADRYQWGAGRVLDYQRVQRELARILGLFPVRARQSLPPAAIADRYYTNQELSDLRLTSLILPFISGWLPDGSGAAELGLSITPIPAPAGGVALSHTAPAGFLLAPYLQGVAERSIALRSDLVLEFQGAFGSDNAIGLEVLPGAVHLEGDPGSTAFAAAVNLVGSPATPIRLFGTNTTSRLELTGYALSVGVAGTAASPELLLRAGTALAGGPGRLLLYLEPGDGDSFIARAFGPSPVKLEVGGALTWSSRTGLGLEGAVGLHIRRATTKTVGPLTLHNYALDIAGQTAAQGQAPLAAALTLGASLQLGPVTATVEQVGVTFELTTVTGAQKGLLDNLDVNWGFKAPSGVGITVTSDLVNGGGYLFFDPAKHQYAGAANLTLKTGTREINLNALGLLQTQLPGKPDAYSLLLLITAQFTPIDLGLGFTLSGLGGLVGVNRAANHEYLLGMVRQGQLKQLLFPANVMDDPAGALALVDGAFPATEGRYVIGLMAQLGWGSAANIITLDVALLVELPAPVRIVLLGVLQAVLPSAKNDKLKLRADFLGLVDFGAKKASFDASLTDSHILNFALTGDLAFRLYQGSNPLFVITAGGFHPAFQPPAGAGLTGLRRLRLVLAQGGDLQLKLDTYFAVTSNTVQFGAHLDLTYKIARGFRVEGHFGFDVLFQFSPFRLLAHVEAHVAIMRGNSELLGLHLALDVTGPGPWHIWGEASFKIWFIKIGVNVNATIGASVAEPALPAPDVHELLVKALNEPASWQVEAPTASQPASVLLRPVAAAAGQVFLDPRGALSLRQRVAPLGLTLDKYGTSPVLPRNGRLFELTTLQVGQATYAAGAKGRDELRDFFVPDQFTKLTDAQKLSAASFQQLPNGVRIGSLNALVAAPRATRRIVEYERKDLLSGASGGSKRLGTDTYRQLARGSALGQAVQAALPSGRAAQAVNWQEDTYEVVHAATLGAYPTAPLAPPPFKSQAEAEQYRQQQPAPADLLVVASYELAMA